ncbi:MAG: UDP-N-acetylmuramoyl-L-alanyl-D-glutamate--2,6-diaminopimelate ligase [Chitinophagales bacterium]
MHTLENILEGVPVREIHGLRDVPVHGISMDSRKVQPGDIFVAVRGVNADGHGYIQDVLRKGVSIIVCEELPANLTAITVVLVEDSSKALGLMLANFYNHPGKKMKIVGVTGTNGKTSVATILFRLYRSLGEHCGLLSTVQNQIDDTVIPSTHTTPDAVQLSELLHRMAAAGCSYCFMEVSSHAVHQNRIAGIPFAGGIFTNLTHDHLDYHKTFDNYLKAKKQFFDQLPESAFALSNIDDRNGKVMLQNTLAKKVSYALKSPADFKAKIVENGINGLQLEMDGAEFFTRLIGEFNAYNLLAVYGAARLLGTDKMEALVALSAIAPPEGRFDQVVSTEKQITAIVDYAHTPDALKNVLQTINSIRNGNGKLITVVGCGGDRDAAKRPVMAQVAAHYSDHCVLTSDNPRSENPEAIIEEMKAGVDVVSRQKVLAITNRREAIRAAVMMARPNDVILVAGKGHEKYQEIKGVKFPFDDKDELRHALGLETH